MNLHLVTRHAGAQICTQTYTHTHTHTNTYTHAHTHTHTKEVNWQENVDQCDKCGAGICSDTGACDIYKTHTHTHLVVILAGVEIGVESLHKYLIQ